MRKLPVFRSVGEVFSGVTRHYFQLVFAAWPAVILIAVGLGVYIWAYGEAGFGDLFALVQSGASPEEIAAAMEAVDQRAMGPAYFASILLMFLASAVAAVRWHRFVLMGEQSGALLRREDFRYIWSFIKTMVLYIAMIVVGGVIVAAIFGLAGLSGGDSGAAGFVIMAGGIAIIVGYLVVLGIFLRLMLALPDAAVGGSGKVFAAFSASAGNTWRMVGYAILIGIVFALAVIVVAVVVGLVSAMLGGGIVTTVLAAVVGLAAYFYFLMSQITMLSVAYREIVGLPGGHEGEATAAEPSPGL